jgi:hypothetical protein
MTRPFNSDFFSIAAAVIPVLILALTLQGDFLLQVLVAVGRLGKRARRTLINRPTGRSGLRQNALRSGQLWLYQVLETAGMFVVVAALWGEIVSLLALKRQSSTPGTESGVFWVTVSLTAMVGVASVFRYVMTAAAEAHTTKEPEGDQPIGSDGSRDSP